MADDVASDVGPPWDIEIIPDDAVLYMRAHKDHFRGGAWQPGVFRDQSDPKGNRGLSAQWQKYCNTPEDARKRAKVPQDNAIFKLIAGDVRKINGLEVVHSPLPEHNDRAHTNIIGNKTDSVRTSLMLIYDEVLPFYVSD